METDAAKNVKIGNFFTKTNFRLVTSNEDDETGKANRCSIKLMNCVAYNITSNLNNFMTP